MPTFRELGIDIVSGAYRGIAVSKSMPEPIRKKLAEMIGKINVDPALVKRMEDGGFAMVDYPWRKERDIPEADFQGNHGGGQGRRDA